MAQNADRPAVNTPLSTDETIALPRIVITFCTQCKWMLRAAYLRYIQYGDHAHNLQFAQELLSTFNTDLGEVALRPATGGIFSVDLITAPIARSATGAPASTAESTSASTNNVPSATSSSAPTRQYETTRLWDRKTDGGFPETKELKRRVRDIIDPQRDLGHVDRHSGRQQESDSRPAKHDASLPSATALSDSPSKSQDSQFISKAPDRGCEDCK